METAEVYLQHPNLPERHLPDPRVLLRLEELLDGHQLAVVAAPTFQHHAV